MSALFAVAVAAYLVGSIPVGYLIVRWRRGIDVRTVGSGNIGMTNVTRVLGPAWGTSVLVLDIAKGILGVMIPVWIFPGGVEGLRSLQAAGGLFMMIGNIFPITLDFKGGKGVGVAIGIFAVLLPVPTAVAIAVFAAVVLSTRMISAGSLSAALGLVVSTFLLHRPFDVLSAFAVLAAAAVGWTHRSNIRRILAGNENRIGTKKAGNAEKRSGGERRSGFEHRKKKTGRRR